MSLALTLQGPSILSSLFAWVYSIFVFWPIHRLYRFGPRWLGGWEGTDLHHICATLSPRTSVDLWMENEEKCCALVERHLESCLVIGELLWVVLLVYIGCKLAYDFFWRRRLMNDMKTILQSLTHKPPLALENKITR